MTTIATSTAAITAKVMICIISRSATAAPPASGAPRYTPQTPSHSLANKSPWRRLFATMEAKSISDRGTQDL